MPPDGDLQRRSRQGPQDVDGAVETAVPHVRLATFIIYISHFLRLHEGAERESYANPFSFIGSMYQIDKQNHPDYAIDEEAFDEDQILADYRIMRLTESQWVQLRPPYLRGFRVPEADERKEPLRVIHYASTTFTPSAFRSKPTDGSR
ncbi:hypothetical protein C8035_v004978 [Colletotrichum spinosum]|uniref:Uncharacterized protein n=1 Tax=Colletotrichum spinosum TaxID=1347390 RepID=A0A4R8QLY3_9PEZI|nr:hypothetical protein C8035_v004978 [Colletotrichum spinosum]